jgi:hypothetical protein
MAERVFSFRAELSSDKSIELWLQSKVVEVAPDRPQDIDLKTHGSVRFNSVADYEEFKLQVHKGKVKINHYD